MTWVDFTGVTLSGLAVVMLIGLLTHSLSRSSPNPQGRAVRGFRRILARWAWPAVLSAAFLLGLFGVPLRRVADSIPPGGQPESSSVGHRVEHPADQRRYTVRAPFYRRERRDEERPGGGWRTTERYSVLQLPWFFLGTSTAYLLFVVRGSRRATRFD